MREKAAAVDDHPMSPEGLLGQRIRELRKARGMTLEGVAKTTNLSIGYLSQIERDLANPSIKTLHDIAGALGVNISWFFDEPRDTPSRERDKVVRHRNRRVLSFGSGVADELLSPNLGGQLELLFSRLKPGASSGDDPYIHRGEEAGVVIQGELELWINEEKFHLEAGDSFAFKSTAPHRYQNPGDVETVVIWAVTPPSY